MKFFTELTFISINSFKTHDQVQSKSSGVTTLFSGNQNIRNGGGAYERLITSLSYQSLTPQKVIVYIAKGYRRPEFSNGIETYVEVSKGMVMQRALDYKEIDTDYILLLDDDMELAPDSAEKILRSMVEHKADCISAETNHNQNMSYSKKIYNIFVNMTFPLYASKWGMKIGRNGAMSYNANPSPGYYPTQTGEGGVLMVRKQAWLDSDIIAEKWMDTIGFAYGDDFLEVYKMYSRGYKCGMLYGSGIKHLDAASSSGVYKQNPERFRQRSRSILVNWHRMLLNKRKLSLWGKVSAIMAFGWRCVVIQPSYILAAIQNRNWRIALYHFLGLRDGIRYITSKTYQQLPPYC